MARAVTCGEPGPSGQGGPWLGSWEPCPLPRTAQRPGPPQPPPKPPLSPRISLGPEFRARPLALRGGPGAAD